MLMLNNKYIIKHTIDVFITDLQSENKILITFNRMTTREKIEIVGNKKMSEFLTLLDGCHTLSQIQSKLGNFDYSQLEKLIQFLIEQHLIIDTGNLSSLNSQYSRQIAFFDDLFLVRSGEETQRIIENKHIAILGCGAVTGMMAEGLIRAGVKRLTLVDYKKVTESCLERHLYLREKDIGQSKVFVLANYLKRINQNLEIIIHNEKLFPHTDLDNWINDDIDLVINGCDEPYIGYTSLKLGRYLQQKHIPLYVMGGFDAHLMSSGELVCPPHTPCIDCIQQHFNIALRDWKPTYVNLDKSEQLMLQENEILSTDNHRYLGSAGGLAIMSSFSAHLSMIRVLHFLANDSLFNYDTNRYEYLPNSGEVTEVNIQKQKGCIICDK